MLTLQNIFILYIYTKKHKQNEASLCVKDYL